MGVDADPPPFELVLELVGGRLVVISGDDYRCDINIPVVEVINEFHGVGIVGNSEVRPHFLSFNITGINTEDHFGFVLELVKKSHFDIGVVAWENAGSVVVKKEFPSKFEIKLVELIDPFEDGGGLFPEVDLEGEPILPLTALKHLSAKVPLEVLFCA